MKNSITVRDIRIIRYSTNEFVILNLYISELVNNKIKIVEIIAEVHLIQNLKVKLLIDVDVLNSEEMNISFCSESLFIVNKEE
jgi:hypothetical protein